MAVDDQSQIALRRIAVSVPGIVARLHKVRKLAAESGLLGRMALHSAFLLVALAGWALCAAVVCDRGDVSAAVSSPTHIKQSGVLAESFAHTPQDALSQEEPSSLPAGGTGGESEDLLLAAVVPHTTVPRRYRIEPITYTVQPGENVSTVADRFDISVETILWNNGTLEDNPDYLDLGDVLTILPVSGVYHTVAEDDTLESIAQEFKASVEDIISYEGNRLAEPYTLAVGQKLIVPGGRKPYKVRHVVAWSGEIPAGAKRGTGVFGWPMSGWISQRYHEYHQAVDIAGPKGTPIKAADSGYVAVTGRSDTGYGRYVLIDHGNGFQTLYAHFSVIYVEIGQSVAKGQTIGLCGSTGKSTGPHVHFELKLNGVRRNPLIYLK